MILDKIVRTKRNFDVNNKKDVALYRTFIIEGRWGVEGCPFALEYPYLTVPDMIKDKMVHKIFGIEFNREHHWK